ncbi:GtrA family protein [uncultured Desulfovibrio sp.]|uniref:GtrA family protein n=1 Tax=uncultured Desulfovibrio sp. TaxID=167968 RepID=UPI003415E548
MLNKYTNIRTVGVRFILYSLIGVSGVAIDFILFYILVSIIGIHYIPANIISIFSGATNNFILNARLNFKVHDKKIIRYISFLSIACVGMLCSSTVIFICVSQFGLSATTGKIASILIVTLIQFTLNTLITFRRKQ